MKNVKTPALLFLISFIYFLSVPFNVEYPVHDETFSIKALIKLNPQIEKNIIIPPTEEDIFHQWAIAPYLITTSIGFLVSKINFSYFLLRLSIVVIATLCSVVLFFLLREFNLNKNMAFIGSVIFIANPLIYISGHKFMSEIPFIFFSLLSILFYVRGIKNNNKKNLLLGSLISVIAFYDRQLAILIPLAAILSHLVFNRKLFQYKKVLILILPIIFVFPYLLFMETIYGSLLNPNLMSDAPASILAPQYGVSLWDAAKHILFDVIYCGFAIIPFAIIKFIEDFRNKSKISILLLFLSFLSTAILVLCFRPFPLIGADTFEAYGTFILPQNLRVIITLLSLLSGITLFYFMAVKFYKDITRKTFNIENFILILFGLFFVFTLFKTGIFVDRYLIMFIPMIIIIIMKDFDFKPNINKITVIIAIVLIGLYSWVLTYNYFNYHSAVWNSVEELVLEKGIAPADIEGNMEVNVYFFNSWKNENAKYVITNDYLIWAWKQDVSQHKLLKEIWYPTVFGKDKIYIYEKIL